MTDQHEPNSASIQIGDYPFDDCISKAEAYPSLGPNYFAGRIVAERFMAHFKEEHFSPLIDQFTSKFRDKLWSDVLEWLLSDVESNLSGEITRLTDGTVNALLSGKPWALNLYVKDAKWSDGAEIREAVARHIPAELQDVRVADLEAEIARLRNENDDLRRYR